MNWAETKAFLFPCLPSMLRDEMDLMYPGELRELRIRVGRPALLRTGSRSALLPWMPDAQQVETLAEALSEHSLYARGDETGRGFVTLRGGHRMGLCGSMAGREGRRRPRRRQRLPYNGHGRHRACRAAASGPARAGRLSDGLPVPGNGLPPAGQLSR